MDRGERQIVGGLVSFPFYIYFTLYLFMYLFLITSLFACCWWWNLGSHVCQARALPLKYTPTADFLKTFPLSQGGGGTCL